MDGDPIRITFGYPARWITVRRALLFPLLSVPLAAAVPTAGRAQSLRLATYNAQFFPAWIEGVRDLCCDNFTNRPQRLAERIRAGNYDIVVLNELFSEDVKEELVSELSAAYPYYVKHLAANPALGTPDVEDLQDSGLMLFSKVPFAPLPRGREWYPLGSTVVARTPEGPWDEVGFREFGDCGGPADCRADKGVGFVRLRHPTSGRLYNVFFTHLDAEASNARAAQLSQIEQFMRYILTDQQLVTEAVFLLGDLNIRGDLHRAPEDRQEWRRHFDRDCGPAESGSGCDPWHRFFKDMLYDALEYELHSPAVPRASRDPMATFWNTPSAERVDYILRNDPPLSVGI